MWLLPLGASFLYWGIGLLSLIFTAILSEPDRTIISIPGSQLKELVQVKRLALFTLQVGVQGLLTL